MIMTFCIIIIIYISEMPRLFYPRAMHSDYQGYGYGFWVCKTVLKIFFVCLCFENLCNGSLAVM